MGMTIEEAITRYKSNAEYERTHGNLQGCLEFRQLAEWLHKYQKIKEIIADWESDGDAFEMSEPYWLRLISEVVEDGDVD